MSDTKPLDAKHARMLELLAQGASTRTLARAMGFSEGTIRVYLHNLYRVLGVKNRTEAVLWHLGQAGSPAAEESAREPVEPVSFGEVALRDGLLATLGIMESFLGPYGRPWEAAHRLKGGHDDEELDLRRRIARLFWRALLDGDFAAGKAFHDENPGGRLAWVAPSEVALLAILLLLGGYSHAASQVERLIPRGRKGGAGLSGREATLLDSLQGALYRGDDGLAAVHRLAASSSTPRPLRHVAWASLFHACRMRGERNMALSAADALWQEAEASRRELEAMGVRPLASRGASPVPVEERGKGVAAAREKALSSR